MDDSAVADAIGQRLLRLLRLATRQWWITRGASESLAPLQNQFRVDADGQPVEGAIQGTRVIMPWLFTEELLDAELLQIASNYLSAGADATPSLSTLMDAVFEMQHGNSGQAVLLAAIACEAAFSEQTYEAVARGDSDAATARDARKIKDLRQRVDSGARQVFGRSFAEDHPRHAASLGILWVARHALAHGSREQRERRSVLSDREELYEAMLGAFEFFRWIATLRPRTGPDLMQLFVKPLARDPKARTSNAGSDVPRIPDEDGE